MCRSLCVLIRISLPNFAYPLHRIWWVSLALSPGWLGLNKPDNLGGLQFLHLWNGPVRVATYRASWSFDGLSSECSDTMGKSQIIVIVLSSTRTGGERVWMPSPLRRIIIEKRLVSSSSYSLILCLVQKPGFDGLNYLTLQVGFSAWARECWKQLMGERSFWIEPQRPLLSFPGSYLCCRGEALWLGSESHTRLTECSSVSGCSWKLRALHSPGGVLSSTEFGKHCKQTPWTLACLLVL